MSDERFILCNKTTDNNVWDTWEKQCYGWEYVVYLLNYLNDENKELKLQSDAFKDKLCELGVSDVKLYGKRYYTGLEEWLE